MQSAQAFAVARRLSDTFKLKPPASAMKIAPFGRLHAMVTQLGRWARPTSFAASIVLSTAMARSH